MPLMAAGQRWMASCSVVTKPVSHTGSQRPQDQAQLGLPPNRHTPCVPSS